MLEPTLRSEHAERGAIAGDPSHNQSDTASMEGTSRRGAPRDHLEPTSPSQAAEAAPEARGVPTATAHPRHLFPVFGVLAPVLTGADGEIAYPGDPMSLYAALSVAISRAVAVNSGALRLPGYERACPSWARLPDKAARLSAAARDIACAGVPSNTDDTVFDPRVWDASARKALLTRVQEDRPAVVLISSVSPAHRHALEIASIVKSASPDTIVVLGGRHADETMSGGHRHASDISLLPSSTVSVITSGQYDRVVDAVVSGDGYHAVDLLLRAIATCITPGATPRPRSIVRALHALLRNTPDPPGNATICVLDGATPHFHSFRGPRIRLQDLPSPYAAFAIRARFPIFPSVHPQGARTAHAMLSTSCRHSCLYCSESAAVTHRNLRFEGDTAIDAAIRRVIEYVGYGAEALFFDDPIFWNGNIQHAQAFADALASARHHPHEIDHAGWDSGDTARLANLQWGAQLTADILASSPPSVVSQLLEAMSRAGCTYIYLGIESMAEEVMTRIHKNRSQTGMHWHDKVRRACSAIKRAGMRVGTSVLFGLDGETSDTINFTIEHVGRLIDAGLVDVASPNILTYHPGTRITDAHGMQPRLDFHSPRFASRPPYSYFEEAFPNTVSRLLCEEDVWRIHSYARTRWHRTLPAHEETAT